MSLHVQVTPDASQLAKAIADVNIVSFLRGELNRVALSVERYAKQLTPVATGRLRSSIHTSPASFSLEAVVSTDTDYAIYVHDGTKYMRARPFMTMAAGFAQVAELKDINVRLDKEFTKSFKAL